MESDVMSLIEGLQIVMAQLHDRVLFLEGQTNAQQLVIAHLSTGVAEEARAEASIALALLQDQSSQKHPSYVEGVKAGSLLYLPGQGG